MTNIFSDPKKFLTNAINGSVILDDYTTLLMSVDKTNNLFRKILSIVQTDEYENYCNHYLENDKEIIEFIQKIDSEITGMQTHLGGKHPGRIHFSFISPGVITYETYWKQSVGDVVWSQGNIKVKNIFALMVLQIKKYGLIQLKISNKKTEIPKPLFKYHPERYFQTREYFERSKNFLKKGFMPDVVSFDGADSINRLCNELITECNTKGLKHPLINRVHENNSTFIVNNEITVAQDVLNFVIRGKQILDINPDLTFMFSKTDVEDIPLSAIVLPYKSQYIHFGPQKEIELANDWFFDGAYVSVAESPNDRQLLVTLTSTNKDSDKIFLWHSHPEPIYHQRIENADGNVNLITAITESFAKQINAIKENISSDKDKEILEEFSSSLDIEIVDVREKNNEIRIATNESLFNQFQKAIGLVVNALCYLTAHPEDKEALWPSSAPIKYVEQSKSNKPTESKRAESKLAKLGYTKIHYFGRDFKHNNQNITSDIKDTHWRRGHHKRQPFGPKNSLRKIVWIMPTLINKHLSKDKEMKGHIYKIKAITDEIPVD